MWKPPEQVTGDHAVDATARLGGPHQRETDRMPREKKQWKDLSGTQRAAIVAGATVEIVVTTAALVDLVRRPKAAVRGPKWLWAASFVVQPVGPLTYFAVGRRRP